MCCDQQCCVRGRHTEFSALPNRVYLTDLWGIPGREDLGIDDSDRELNR